MTKQYDFVVTSGGIGPTHDGELQFPKVPYIAILGHDLLPFHHYPRRHFLALSLVESLSLPSYLSFSAFPSFLDFVTTSILASQSATNTNRITGPSRSTRLWADRDCLLNLETELIYRYHLRISGRSL